MSKYEYKIIIEFILEKTAQIAPLFVLNREINLKI
jgi:hypothetical protein